MRVLGIDPGIARLGWGVVSEKNGKQKAVAFGCLTTKANTSDDKRLKSLFSDLKKIIKKYKPQALAVEDLFFAANAKTAFQVGQAKGVVLLASSLQNIPVASYTPLQIKMALTGYGRAEKKQVEKMACSILKLEKKPKIDDTADALAVALTYLFLHKFEEKIK